MSFNEMYRGSPPWDIGRPQPEVVRLAQSGAIVGSVIDVGCGTGEHAMLLASMGHPALGVDSAPLAIQKAKAKAKERKSSAKFLLADALHLGPLGVLSDTAIDSGLFHVFGDKDRPRYAESVAGAVKPGGRLFMLCFSDREPDGWGPRRVSKEEIRQTFRGSWTVESITNARFETNLPGARPFAYLTTAKRL
ncbi:MAG TPA: class I SAM-dependent methyltransferase [Nitrososphaerales archaeon]|nr:class I SAM-dependent methyltransferase [Nitrososphaerales archaeon]